jgi:hypothetical protein
VTIRINSRALWFSALRGLGWGFLLFEVLCLVASLVSGPLSSGGGTSLRAWVTLVVAAVLAGGLFVFPVYAIAMSAIRATRPPSVWWARTMLVYAVLTPVLLLAALERSNFWGTEPGYVYLWTVTIVSMAASGFALLPLRGARPGEDEGEVVLPLWQIPLAVLAGLALGGFVYATLYFRWLLPSLPSLEEGAAILLLVPQFLLASTVGCYAVALMWRLSGQRESEAEVSP